MSTSDLPKARIRQPSFDLITASAGLVGVSSMAKAFDVDLDVLRAALKGDAVSPLFIVNALLALPEWQFADLFEIEIYVSSR